jgi:hypothetical protein
MRLRRPSMTRRALALPAAVMVAASLALGGCDVLQRPGAVAIVNGKAISAQEVAETTRQYNAHLVTEPTQKLTEARAAGTLVLAEFVVAHVESTGSWKPDARYNSDLVKIPDATQNTRNLLKFVSITSANTLTQQDVDAILATMKKAKIEMDPRYGTFDAEQGGFVDTKNNWIVPPPTPTGPGGAPPQPGQ